MNKSEFLLSALEAVFESFVTEWMRHRLSDRWLVKPQSRAHSLTSYNNRALFQLRPDVW